MTGTKKITEGAVGSLVSVYTNSFVLILHPSSLLDVPDAESSSQLID